MKGLNFKRGDGFDIETNGNIHRINFVRESGKYALYIDDAKTETFTPSNFITMMFGDLNDYEFILDEAQVVVAMRFGRPRIAVDGKYTDTGEEFKAVLPLPIWGYAFVVAVMIPPLVFSQTFWDLAIGGCYAYMCTHFILKNPDLKADTTRRIVYCVLVTLASWIIFYFFTRLGVIGSFL